MGTFKRLTTSIIASFESVVGQIENHEALVTSAIKEVEQSAARARAQLNRVRADGQQMRRRLTELKDSEEQWKDRAKRTAELDEQKAIECLKRYKKARNQISTLELQEREHARLERQLNADLEVLDNKVQKLRQQRNLLRTRQSRAEALQLIEQVDSSTMTEIDDIFTRWEAKVLCCEGQASTNIGNDDPLDEDFTSEEEETELKSLLASIKTEMAAERHDN